MSNADLFVTSEEGQSFLDARGSKTSSRKKDQPSTKNPPDGLFPILRYLDPVPSSEMSMQL